MNASTEHTASCAMCRKPVQLHHLLRLTTDGTDTVCERCASAEDLVLVLAAQQLDQMISAARLGNCYPDDRIMRVLLPTPNRADPHPCSITLERIAAAVTTCSCTKGHNRPMPAGPRGSGWQATHPRRPRRRTFVCVLDDAVAKLVMELASDRRAGGDPSGGIAYGRRRDPG
jgi:hypothetical protein